MTASNAVFHLHNEDYRRPFEAKTLDHRGMITMAGRDRESLAGRWRFVLDPFEEGLRQGWHRDCFLPVEGRPEPWDYDIGGGDEIDVPSCWNLQRPEWMHYEGTAWAGRWFDYQKRNEGERLFLRVGAANYDTLVFLNGACLGHHRGGSTPFFVELTRTVGERNFLHLCVNNERRADRVPMNHIDWFNYGGVFREVELVRLPDVFIRSFRLPLGPKSGAIEFAIALSDPIDADVLLSISELGIERDVPVKGGAAQISIDARPDLWSPEHPKLYEVTLACQEDRVTDRIGFREIRTDGQDILLNGKNILLKGVCVHEDDAEQGRLADEHDIRRRFTHAKELGCNFLRLAHYPHHERVAEIADELGLMLWEEIPVYWAIAFSSETTATDARNQIRELISRDINRASVIVWGIGNENADTDERLAFMAGLAETCREQDPTRLVSAACLVDKQACRLEDRLADHLDLVGINEYYGWYEPDYDDLCRIITNYDLEKPIVITEVGADAPAGRTGDEDELFSETHQCCVYRQQTKRVAELSPIRGFCPWLLYDFRTLRRHNQFQDGFNRKGLIAADKTTKKLAFDVVRLFYQAWKADEG
ncbi:MAG: glycoside hydrolase family 2 protein [Geminicoccaceae bacterium]